MKDLTKGNEGKLILLFALPMLIGNVFQQSYNVIDSIVVGNYLGKEALAAIGASFPVFFVLISLIIGISSGSTVLIAQYFGAKDYKNLKKSIDTMYIVLFAAAIIITAIGLIFSKSIFKLLNLPEEVVPQALIFFNIYLGGIIFMFGFNGTSAVLRGIGDSKTPLYFLILSTILNIIFVLLFVTVFHWGIAGAAFSTILALAITFFAAIIYLNKNHPIINFSFRNIEFDKEIFKKSLNIGIPTGLQQTFVALGMMAIVRIVNGFGTDAIAAYSIAGRIDSFAALPAMNFSMALSTFVGQNLGAGKPDRAKRGYKYTLLISSLFSLIVTIFVLIFNHQLIKVFNQDLNVIEIGADYLLIVSIFYIAFSTMFITTGLLRGAGDTLIPMFITLFSLWILRIPICYFLSLHFGVLGLWWGIPVSWIFGSIMSYIYFLKGNWKKKKIVQPLVVEEFNISEN